jgi:hypothetical protein
MKTGVFFGILGIFYSFATPLRAEDLPTMPLSYLTQYAKSVVEVKPGRLIKAEDRMRWRPWVLRCAILNTLLGENANSDTLNIYISDTYAVPGFAFHQPQDKLLVFISGTDSIATLPDKIYHVVLSGIYIIRGDTIIHPFQSENPGPYHYFHASPTRVSFYSEMYRQWDASKELEKAFSIKDPERSNQEVMEWVTRNDTFPGNILPDNYDILQSALLHVVNSNLWKDAWKAILYYKKRFPEYSLSGQGYEGFTFARQDALDFLMNTALNKAEKDEIRQEALLWLNDYNLYWHWERPNISPEQQRSMLKQLLPLLEPVKSQSNLQYHAMRLCFTLSDPNDADRKDRICRDAFPALIRLYQAHQLSTYFERDLDNFLQQHLPEGDWKK